MPLWTTQAMAEAMQASRSGVLPEAHRRPFDRHPHIAPGDAFFAIQGDSRDGHEFVEAALKDRRRVAVVAAGKRDAMPKNAPLLVVPDVLEGLRALARAARARSAAEIHRRHRLGRQDQHQGGAAARAVG